MSMEISGDYRDYKNDSLERVRAEQDRAKETCKEQNAGIKSERFPVPKDEYISSEKSGSKPSGLYRLRKDAGGNPKVMYDAPKKAVKEKEAPRKDEPAKEAEECTADTDNVDREIKELKEEKKRLEQQIRAAAGDEEKRKIFEKKLARIEGELRQKDNDTYRRQRAVFSCTKGR